MHQSHLCGRGAICTGSSSSSAVFPCQYHSTNAPYAPFTLTPLLSEICKHKSRQPSNKALLLIRSRSNAKRCSSILIHETRPRRQQRARWLPKLSPEDGDRISFVKAALSKNDRHTNSRKQSQTVLDLRSQGASRILRVGNQYIYGFKYIYVCVRACVCVCILGNWAEIRAPNTL